MTKAEKLLLHVYSSLGPRGKNGKVVPVLRYAKMPLSKVNSTWDFDGRVLMHEIATVLVKPVTRENQRR